MHWSQTESSKCSLDRVSTRPGPPPYGYALCVMATLRYLLYTPHTPRARSRATYFTPLEPGVHPPHTPHPRSGSPWGQHGGISHLARGESPGERSSSTCTCDMWSGPAPAVPRPTLAQSAGRRQGLHYPLLTYRRPYRRSGVPLDARRSKATRLDSRSIIARTGPRFPRETAAWSLTGSGGTSWRCKEDGKYASFSARSPPAGSRFFHSYSVSHRTGLLRMRKVGTLIGFRESFSQHWVPLPD